MARSQWPALEQDTPPVVAVGAKDGSRQFAATGSHEPGQAKDLASV
jgi:hypothetical protein